MADKIYEHGERLARLEQDVEHLFAKMDEQTKQLAIIGRELGKISGALTSWRGVGAGIALSVSVMWALAWAGWEMFKWLRSSVGGG